MNLGNAVFGLPFRADPVDLPVVPRSRDTQENYPVV